MRRVDVVENQNPGISRYINSAESWSGSNVKPPHYADSVISKIQTRVHVKPGGDLCLRLARDK